MKNFGQNEKIVRDIFEISATIVRKKRLGMGRTKILRFRIRVGSVRNRYKHLGSRSEASFLDAENDLKIVLRFGKL